MSCETWGFSRHPVFPGRKPETGKGEGDEANVNYPMPSGTDYPSWGAALDYAIKRIKDFKPEAFVVSFGAGIFKDDPLSFFRLDHEDNCEMGSRITKLGELSLVTMEGGCAVDDLCISTLNFLETLARG